MRARDVSMEEGAFVDLGDVANGWAAAEHASTGLESEGTRAVPSLLVIVELMLVSTQTQIEERAAVDFACGATCGESGMAQASRLVRVWGWYSACA
ncbi:hypothetical protein C8R44DRAFT_896153 [Mycena epipterygia]|nr:hypothetical protein C8R44DRAFT_896153 [Mycena epipterygia]